MIRIRIILLIIGYLLSIIGILMNVPLLVDYFLNDTDWQAFAIAQFFALFNGVSLIITCRDSNFKDISIKETFILTTLSWIVLTSFAALPFYLSNLQLNYTDSFFEAMSGLTTTGATIITGLDNAPPGILVWRAMLEWIGGIGIIVMALAILPLLRIGGMQLFRTESSDKGEKILPRAKQLCSAITAIYLTLTIICTACLYLAGMSFFDAILHAMTTVSTGGFSTHDASIGFFNNFAIEIIIISFILIGSIPFPLIIKSLRGGWSDLYKDQQILFFFALLISLITLVTFWLTQNHNISWQEALRLASFNVTAVVTTTGFSSSNYALWGEFIVTLMFLISIVGGCTGSTTGGIKIFRFQILYKTAKAQIFKLVHPHGVYKIQYNRNSVSESACAAIMSFFILFCFCFVIMSLLLAFSGLDFVTSISAAGAAIANVGPGLGQIIGPSGNYFALNDFAKWVLSLGMLIGRLEIFTIFVLFSAAFWND